jgi:hypothetical protein
MITTHVVIKKTTKITITKTELLKSFYANYLDLLKDTADEEDLGFFESEINRLSDAISGIHKHGFTQLFQDGYTMMLLEPKAFDLVEGWKEGDEIELVITDKDGSVEVVTQDQMSY